MALSAGQTEVAASQARMRVVVAGRRWGKTHLSIREMARGARLPGQQIFYVAPTYRQAKQTVWNPLKERLSKLNWISKTNESDLCLTLRNGSTISLRGADNFDSLRGVGLSGLIMDECAYIQEEAFTEVLRPTLSDKQGWAMFISTPAGIGNWLYDLYQRGQDPEEKDWSSWQFTTLSGGRVPEAEIAAARRDLSEKVFKQEYEGSFETFSGVIYYNFNRKQNLVPYNLPVPNQILVMTDFNVSPMSAVVAVRTANGLHVIDEIVIYGSNTDELVQEVKNRYPNKSITAFPDPAGAQRKTSAGGRTDITILQNAGFQVKYRNSHPAVRDRINAVNSLLLNAAGESRLLIDPKCRNLIECLEKHCYKPGTSIPEKDGNPDYSHLNDALGYGTEFLFPIKKDIVQQPTGTWGMGTRSVPTR